MKFISDAMTAWHDNSDPNPSHSQGLEAFRHSKQRVSNSKMAPDTSLQPFVTASASSMALPVIPTSPEAIIDAMEDEFVDPDAKLILSDFTQSTIPSLRLC